MGTYNWPVLTVQYYLLWGDTGRWGRKAAQNLWYAEREYKQWLTGQNDISEMLLKEIWYDFNWYSETIPERPPHWAYKCGLSRQVVFGDMFNYIEM